MRIPTNSPLLLLAVGVLFSGGWVAAENIDPDTRHAWAENVGWLDAEPHGNGGEGVQVGDAELSGWMWGENIGWVSLSCKNTLSCATVNYGVLNDGSGILSGHAWAENVGWIDFAPSNSGVVIDQTTGEFSGYAWGENIGWISFNCSNTASCGSVVYRVKTGWICDPKPEAPPGSPNLRVGPSGTEALLSWDRIPGATGVDLVQGTLSNLRTSGGDYGISTEECLGHDRTTTSLLFDGNPPTGDGFWFLIRGQNCGGHGTYDTQTPSQTSRRDAEILSSGQDCSP